MLKNAILDETRKYRYVLSRQWGDSDNFVNFILLNPSTADESKDDQTIRRCINLTKSWKKYDGFYVTNLFAFRTVSPKILKNTEYPIGKENNKYIKEIANKSKIVIIAWGNDGGYLNRDKDVLQILSGIKPPHCLGLSKKKQPLHPRTVKKTVVPIKFILYKIQQIL